MKNSYELYDQGQCTMISAHLGQISNSSTSDCLTGIVEAIHALRSAMVLYELICITRKQTNVGAIVIREIARTAGTTILQNGGVVRKVHNMGLRTLPKPIKKFQATHDEANYFTMLFDSNRKLYVYCVSDCSAVVQKQVALTLNLDPRVLRHSVVKIGDRLQTLALPPV